MKQKKDVAEQQQMNPCRNLGTVPTSCGPARFLSWYSRTTELAIWLVLIVLTGLALGACTSSPAPIESDVVEVTLTPSGKDMVRVAVLAIRSAEAAAKQYGPIIDYLAAELDRPFLLVPVGQEEQFDVVEAGTVDFTFNNPLSAAQIRRLYDTEFLATLSRRNTGSEFSGVIIARADSDIKTLPDIRGKDVTCVAFETAAAGCNFQLFHLLESGILPDDFAAFTETPSQDNIVLGVLNGTFDVGFIRTGQLERMVAEGTLLNLDEIHIVDPQNDDFYFPHSTRLYPEWPFAALAGTDPGLVDAVRDRLLDLSQDDAALRNANADGFVSPTDYGPLDELIEALELRSYDAE